MQNYFEQFGFLSTLAGDISLLAVLVLCSLLLGFIIGRSRLVHLVLHLYIAYSLVFALPDSWMGAVQYRDSMVFLLVLIVLTALGDRIFDIHARASIYGWIATFFLGFLASGMTIAMLLSLLPVESFVWDLFSERASMYFVGMVALPVWFLSPLLFLVFLNMKK